MPRREQKEVEVLTTKEKAIQFIQNFYKPKEHICLIIWSIEDVLERAKERKMKITIADAETIIEKIEDNHDATIGMSWGTIDSYLDEVYDQHKAKTKEKKQKERVSFT